MGIGGKERFLNALIRGLHGNGFDMHVCCLRERGPYYDPLCQDGYALSFLAKKRGVDVAAAIRLKRIIADFSPDVVHTHDFTSLFLFSLASRLGALPARLVVSLHGGHVRLSPGKQALHSALLRRCDVAIGVSQRQVERLRAQLGTRASLIHIPYGVEPMPMHPSTDDREAACAPSPLSDGPVVVMAARFEKPKDQDSLVCAMRQIAEAFTSVECILAGSGRRLRTIQALVAEQGLDRNVRFVVGTTEVGAIISQADVCVLSSFHEGLPICILEYMAAHKPVVASDVGGVCEMVRNEKEGFLVEPGDPDALADRIAFLLRDPATAKQMGKRAGERVEKQFQLRTMLEAYAQQYRALA